MILCTAGPDSILYFCHLWHRRGRAGADDLPANCFIPGFGLNRVWERDKSKEQTAEKIESFGQTALRGENREGDLIGLRAERESGPQP